MPQVPKQARAAAPSHTSRKHDVVAHTAPAATDLVALARLQEPSLSMTSTAPMPLGTTTLTMMARAAIHTPPLPPATVLFDVQPREIVFYDFVPGERYTTQLTFKNRTKFTQFVRVARPDSHHFTLSAPKASTTTLKVAPGLTVCFDVHFAPDENRDYACELPVITEEEQFLIPVRAYGSRGRLELPTQFAATDCPVRGSTRSPVFLRNVTDVDCVWRAEVLQCMAGVFALTPSSGTVAAHGAVLPVELLFRPNAGPTSYDAIVRFFLGPEGDMVQDMPVVGRAVELALSLDCSRVELSDTYLMTEREAVVQLRNESDQTVEFCWMSSYTAPRPDATRHEGEDGAATEDEDEPFTDEAFALSPIRGVLYGRGTRSFTVTFNPQMAVPYATTAFLEVTGKQRRVPLQLAGRGLGPQCRLEYTRLNIGDVYLNAVHEYEVEMSNVGCIEAHYTVVPPTTEMGGKFAFSPATGTLAPGATQVLRIRLQSDLIGLLAEDFHIHLHGSAEELTLEFRGRVMGPTFRFDVSLLDFGLVSYDFWHERGFVLRNTSQTPMHYRLYLPRDSPYVDEFAVTPCDGLLAPMSEQPVLVRLRANTVGSYDTALLIDLVNVGEALDTLPIRATCRVPQLSAGEDKLAYGHCFVGHTYTQTVHVVNTTTLSGKFELTMHESATQDTAEVVIGDAAVGGMPLTIEPRQEMQVPVTLRALTTKAITFTLQLRTVGAGEAPQTILVSAVGCGPMVEVQPSTLSFGDIAVLATTTKELTLNNTSPIVAVYDVELQRGGGGSSGGGGGGHAVFTLEPQHGTIEPYSAATVRVSACLNEEMNFSDVVLLRVQHQDGVAQSVALRASGTGFPIVADVDLQDYHVGDVFTDTAVTRHVVLQNKGRRDQEVQWYNVRGMKVKENSPPIVFTVRPERVILPARGGSVTFALEGRTDRVGVFADEFVLKQTGTLREIMRSRVTGNFIAPLLAYSVRVLQFDYVEGQTGVQAEAREVGDGTVAPTLTKSLTMRNVTGKELLVVLRLRERRSPFTLDGETRFALPSGHSHVVGVRFDPGYRGDHVSHSVRGHLVVAFDNHPHTETVLIAAKLSFPALRLSPAEAVMDFGTILTDTERRRTLTLYNDSDDLPAQFEWKLLTSAEPSAAVSLVSATTVDGERRRLLFDFVPFTGIVAPRASRTVEVVFYGLAGTHVRTAVCDVVGGASHQLRLQGASGEVQLHYSHTSLDFGCMQYYEEATRYITISNPSHVAVSYAVNLSALRYPGCVKVTPASGTLQDKVRLRITFSPTVPDDVVDCFFIEAGHFDPQPIRVCGQGQVNTIAVLGTESSVPCVRVTNAAYEKALEECRSGTAFATGVSHTAASARLYAEDIVPYPTRTKNLSSLCPVLDPLAIEAERLSFCTALTLWRRRQPHGAPLARRTESAVVTMPPPAAVPGHKVAVAADVDAEAADRTKATTCAAEQTVAVRQMRRSSTSARGSAKLVLTTYELDFGHMTRNDVRTTKVRLINTCAENLSLLLDSKEVAKLPITLLPARLPKLSATAETTLQITLHADGGADKIVVRPGENRFSFMIDIKGGPAVVLECRCYVATPCLRISDSSLAFDSVVLGQLRILPLTLTNEQAVACGWKVVCREKGPHEEAAGEGGGGGHAAHGATLVTTTTLPAPHGSQFWCQPLSGSLAPHESTVLKVCFAPHRDGDASATLRFHFTSNGRDYDVRCRGVGRQLRVVMSPGVLQFPVIRPFQVAHQVVQVTNHEPHAVELFSRNLDPQYRLELQMLQDALQVGEERSLMLPVREAGAYLPDGLLQHLYTRLDGEQQQLATVCGRSIAAAAVTIATGESDAATASKQRSPSPVLPAARVAGRQQSSLRLRGGATRGEGSGVGYKNGAVSVDDYATATGVSTADGDVTQGEAQGVRPAVLLLVGPPQSGKSTQLRRLCAQLDYVALDLDALIAAATGRDGAVAELIRDILTTRSAEGAARARRELTVWCPPSAQSIPPALRARQSAFAALFAPEEGTAGHAAVSATCGRAGGAAATTASARSNNSPAASKTPQAAATPSSDENARLSSAIFGIVKALVISHVREVRQARPRAGFVLDDLSCALSENKVLLYKAVRSACEALGYPLHLVALDVSAAIVGLRQMTARERWCAARVREAAMEPLPEPAYEALTPAARDLYNLRLQYYNQCRRELTAATRQRAHYQGIVEAGTETTMLRMWQAAAAGGPELGGATPPPRSNTTAATAGKAGRRTDASEPPPQLDWDELGAMERFRQLHSSVLAHLSDEATPAVSMASAATPAASQPPTTSTAAATVATASPAATTSASETGLCALLVIDGEQTSEAVTEAIVRRLQSSAPTEADGNDLVPSASSATPASSLLAGGNVARSGALAPAGEPSAAADAVTSAAGSGVSPFGLWYYVDPQRLEWLRCQGVDSLRFHSRVERDVTMMRRNAKNKVVVPVQAYEETTRWLLPPRSSAYLVVELCCGAVGEHRWSCHFGLLGTLQTLQLGVQAHIALPDIVRDERAIFPVTRARLTAGRQPCKVFLTSKRVYNFGPLLIPAPVSRRRRSEHPAVADSSRASTARPTSAESLNTMGGGGVSGSPSAGAAATASTTATETLRFSNAGDTAAEVTLSFANEKDKTFTVSPMRFTLAVGATQEVALTAAPETLGELGNRLIACVKDNPTPWVVQLLCTGSRPAVTLDERKEAELDFGRTTLHRTVEKTVTVVNVSCNPIYWRLHGLDRLPAELQPTETSGVLESNEACPLRFVFAPTRMGLHAVTLQLLVSDAVRTHMVYESLPLVLRAEAYDVVLEWTREVAFRLMHIGETKQETIRILNKGPYDVNYQIRVPRRLQGILSLSPQTGTIRGLVGHKDAAVATVEVTARFEREGEIPRKLGQLEVAFIDPERDELLYPLQTIPVSGEAWYTRFTVKPSSIDFGSCFFSQRKQAAFELRNTGRFPVQFRLFNARETGEAAAAGLPSTMSQQQQQQQQQQLALGTPTAEMEESTSTRRGAGGVSGSKAAKTDLDFRIGCFTVSPARGVVAVGEALALTVITVPERESRTHEMLGLAVEQCEPELAQRGVLLELIAHPATPGITADLSSSSDVETIFEEQQVVYRLDQFDKGVKAYGKEDRTFSFGTSLVGHRVEERFRIANSSPLPCTVLAQILPANTTAKGAPPPEGFDFGGDTETGAVSTRLVLPPFESRFVTIGFTPSSLRRFDARLLAVVEDGTDARTNTLAFNLTGEGTLPSVEYVLPPRLVKSTPVPVGAGGLGGGSTADGGATGQTRAQRQKAKDALKKTQSALLVAPTQADANAAAAGSAENVITMPLTLVGGRSTRSFVVRNTGRVPADVRVTLASDELFAAGLTVSKRNTDLTIPVGAEESFEVSFAPTQTGKSFMQLRVDLADNPFEAKEFNIEAESYAQAISFDDIDPVSADSLTLDNCYVQEPQQYTFRMRNNTSATLRFAWRVPTSGMVEMRPATGHVAAGAAKEMTLTMLCREATAAQRVVSCEVQAQAIELLEGGADWDGNAVVEKWVIADDAASPPSSEYGRRNLRKVLEPVPEPAYRLLDTVADGLLQPLHVRYVCDIPSYDLALVNPTSGVACATLATSAASHGKTAATDNRIAFATTKMFQRRIVTLQLTNTGVVALPFAFQLTPLMAMDEQQQQQQQQQYAISPLTPQPVEDGASAGVFTIEPASGTVAPGATRQLVVAFAPVSAETVGCGLRGHFAHSARPDVELPLTGTGECPLVHFQLPASTYLQQRVDGEAGPLLDPDTLVLELLTRSLHTRTTMRFKVVNPTATAYEFEWVDQSARGGLSPFRCLTPSGTIAAGKKLDVAFEFSADTLGVRESLWRFCIPGKAMVPFLLVGRAVEPAVSLNASKVQFGHINVGQRAERVVLLENRDEVPFAFSFDKAEMAGTASFLTVKPLAGTIGAKEKLPITICFTPQDEMEYNVPLACFIKRASTPLKINVKGEGVCVHDTLHIESATDDAPMMAVTRGQLTHLNLGRVQVNDHVTRRFVLTNAGQHPFDLVVLAPERRFVTIDGATATVLPRRRAVVTFTYRPTVEEALRGYKLQFKIGNKISYQVGILATTYIPKLNLSAERIDFGPRFITTRGTTPGGHAGNGTNGEVTATLTLMNNDKELITVDCSVSEGNDWCELDTQSFVAKPGEATEVHLTFSPREVRMYDDKLQLMLNGVHPMFVALSGEGVVPRVEVLNHFAKLGVARIGERREVEVKVECRSRIATPLSFVGCLDEDLASKGISIAAPQTILLKPREVRVVTILFKPTKRMGEFQREMKMLVCGRECPFALVTGACEDSEIHLDVATLKFSDVVVGSSATRRLVIMNSGDISQRFAWTGLRQAAGLSVTPQTGFVRSHTECICEFHYTPPRADSVLSRNLVIEFDNSPPLSVLIEANGMARTPSKGALQFRCRARETVVERVVIENVFPQVWTFDPEFDHGAWSGPRSVTVKPKSKVELAITYSPMRATGAGEQDEGTMFIPQPDGNGLTYKLQGIADPPGPSGPMTEMEAEVDTPCTARFQVRNWATAPLRFAREVRWTPAPDEGILSVKGPSWLEVPAEASKEYTLTFASLREGLYRGVVSFSCPERNDMTQYYEVSLQVATRPIATVVELLATVRTAATYSIALSNPLSKAVTVQSKVEPGGGSNAAGGGGSSPSSNSSGGGGGGAGNLDHIEVAPSVVVPAKSTVQLPIEFFPLVHREYAPVKVTVSSPELGSSSYLLKLRSAPATQEKVTRLTCPLGQSTVFTLSFTHFCKSHADFAIRIGGGEEGGTGGPAAASGANKNAVFTKVGQGMSIKVQATTRPRGQEVATDFVYEPHAMGGTREVIEFVSAAGGTYSFPIIANCVAPQRQGPFAMRLGQSTPVPFKNVFLEPVTINVATDSHNFTVARKSEVVAAKKSISIPVQCRVDEGVEVVYGKLILSCTPPGESRPVEWVYYLEGSRPEAVSGSAVRRVSPRKR